MYPPASALRQRVVDTQDRAQDGSASKPASTGPAAQEKNGAAGAAIRRSRPQIKYPVPFSSFEVGGVPGLLFLRFQAGAAHVVEPNFVPMECPPHPVGKFKTLIIDNGLIEQQHWNGKDD